MQETDASETEEDDDDDEDGTDGGDTGTETEADARPPFPKAAAPKRPFWANLKRTLSSKSSANAVSLPEQSGAASDQDDQAAEESSAQEINATSQPLEDPTPDADSDDLAAAAAATTPSSDPDVVRAGLELDRKVVAETLRTMRGMYFSYQIDVTRSLQKKDELRRAERAVGDQAGAKTGGGLIEPHPTLPLWRRADKRFFWNATLQQPFIEAGVSSGVIMSVARIDTNFLRQLHAYIIVLMQGFVTHVTVSLPLQPYSSLTPAEPTSPAALSLDLFIMSRRSIERPGLRYQRRGANGDGEVANFVEVRS